MKRDRNDDMRILITAGGTVERIDDVRGITNFSTGRLSSLIAEEYAENPAVSVTFIHGKTSLKPANPAIKLIEIASVEDLLEAVTDCLTKETYDVVVHSMAVSDYYLTGTASEEAVINELLRSDGTTATLKNNLQGSFTPIDQGNQKISSDIETMYFQLQKTPKVINHIKELQPETILVGFKLLVGVETADLLTVAKKLMVKNQCDYVLANDKQQISGDQHIGHLVDTTGNYETYKTKQAIAQGIVEQTVRGRKSK